MWGNKRSQSPFYASYKFLGIVENNRFSLQIITDKIERITRKSRKKME